MVHVFEYRFHLGRYVIMLEITEDETFVLENKRKEQSTYTYNIFIYIYSYTAVAGVEIAPHTVASIIRPRATIIDPRAVQQPPKGRACE